MTWIDNGGSGGGGSGGGAGGTVTSVGLSVPSDVTATGSPVTTAGTLAVTRNPQAANMALIGPATGLSAAPTYRALVPSDVPVGIPLANLAPTGATSGQVLAYTGTVFAPSTLSFPNYLPLAFFGDGFLGNATITSGTTFLTGDAYYGNLTINGTGSINTNGYRLFVSGVLDLTAAPNGAIVCPLVGASVGSGIAGGLGGTGSNTGAAAFGGASAGSSTGSRGGLGGGGGAGANATGAGGLGGGPSPVTSAFVNRATVDLTRGLVYVAGGQGGAGGGGGGGSATLVGGTGGGGGAGGGVLFVAAQTLSRGAATAVGAIKSLGLPGLVGGAGAAGAAAGGGGGGGGGGWVYCLFGSLTGTTAAGLIDVSGGIGGAGGSTTAGGVGGNGGTAGTAQSIVLSLGTNSIFIGNPGSAGASASGTGPQTDNFTLNSLTLGTYTITINNVGISFAIGATDTQQSVLTSLGNTIQGNFPATSTITGTGPATVMTITATTATALVYTGIPTVLTRTTPAASTPTGGAGGAGAILTRAV